MNTAVVRGRAILLPMLVLLLTGPVYGGDKLVVLAEDDAAPWSFENGTGYANDVVKAAFAAAGVEVELQVVPYERGKQMVLKGTGVACFSMSWLPEYAGKIVFADQPLFTCQADFFENLNRPLAVRNMEGITNKIVVGITEGYEYPPALIRLRDRGVVRLEAAASEDLNLKKLAAGRIDAAILNYDQIKTAGYMLAKAGVVGKVGRAFKCGELRSFLGFSQVHPQGLWARAKFNQGWQIIEAHGTLRTIEKAWIARMLHEMAKAPDVPGGGVSKAVLPPAGVPQP